MKKETQRTAISREIVIEYLDELLRGMRGTNEKNLRGENFYILTIARLAQFRLVLNSWL